MILAWDSFTFLTRVLMETMAIRSCLTTAKKKLNHFVQRNLVSDEQISHRIEFSHLCKSTNYITLYKLPVEHPERMAFQFWKYKLYYMLAPTASFPIKSTFIHFIKTND